MKTGITLTLLLLTLAFFTCSNDQIIPPDDELPDTTSHNFTRRKFTFGSAANSYLTDVAIINDTAIWAVGTIYIYDSTRQVDPISYNAAHWNGSAWELKKIKTNACGGVDYPPINSIFAFAANDILFGHIDGSISYYNGIDFRNDCSLITQLNGSVIKMWGRSNNDLYIVSSNGFIAHYQNSVWSKIESGTELNINDIWGGKDKDGKEIALCAAYNFGTGGEKKLLKINYDTVEEIDWVDRELYTVWFNTTDKIYAGGEGLYIRKKGIWQKEDLPELFKFRIRGNDENDLWTTGGFGFTAHYNGAGWKTFEEVKLISGNYVGLDVKGGIVALAGNEGNTAVITIGKRIN